MLQGAVYQISQPKHGNRPHLHVVVLEFSGNKDCIVVPAFSEDGHRVSETIQARLDEGYRIDQVVVSLDNAKHIAFSSGHSGKRASWLVSDPDRLPISEVQQCSQIGVMNEAGLRAIAAGLYQFALTTDRFSAAVMKKLKQLAEL